MQAMALRLLPIGSWPQVGRMADMVSRLNNALEGGYRFVMPYVEGESPRDRLDREGELPVEEAVRIATDGKLTR